MLYGKKYEKCMAYYIRGILNINKYHSASRFFLKTSHFYHLRWQERFVEWLFFTIHFHLKISFFEYFLSKL